MTHTDILVVGAGLAGLPAAIACAENGWRVTLVDQHDAAQSLPEDLMDQRCTAIGSASEGLLRSWGLWGTLCADAQAIDQVHVSQRGCLGNVRLKADELGVAALGHVIENRRWVQSLRQRAHEHPLIDLQTGCAVRAMTEMSTGSLEVTLSSDKTLTTQLLIAADGVNSSVRELAGIIAKRTDYEQSALLTTVRMSEPHRARAFERFTATGPLAFLPRPDNIMSLVWCLAPEQASALAQANEGAFSAALQSQFGHRLGQITAIGPRGVIPLVRWEAQIQISSRVVLLGNAARLLHPVAGQGFNLALRDLASLLDMIGHRSGERPADPGHADLLRGFVTQRRSDQRRVVLLTDALARTFRGKASLPGHVRALGLAGLDSIGPLRTGFAMQSMGYTG